MLFIEGDICDCFSSLDHDVMVRILSEKIRDNRLLRLDQQRAESRVPGRLALSQDSERGSRGGVVSPVMCSIYLHKLDEFVETVLIAIDLGSVQETNPEYAQVKRRLAAGRRNSDRGLAGNCGSCGAFRPGIPHDPGFRRLR